MVKRTIESIVMFTLSAALVFSLASCTKDVDPTIVPAGAVTVKVPVPICSGGIEQAIAKSKGIDRPLVLPIQQLKGEDQQNYDKVQKAYTETVAILVEYAGKLETDRDEIDLQCKASKDAVKTLNTVQPNIPSPTK